MSAYRFALRPRWILSHVLVVLLVVLMVNLGFWQLRRLDEKRDFNATARARQAAAPAPLDEVLAATDSFDDAEAVTFRRVTARGTYDTDHEVLVRGRSLDERPGAWVLTPLLLDGGAAVIVNRGWIPTQGVPDHVPAEVEPPDGTVSVSGQLMATQTRGRFGPKDPASGTLTDLARADVGRIQQQVPYDLYPALVQVAEQRPAQDNGLPEPLPPAHLDEGPHLSYAVQWFCFSTIAVVGYPIILRRRARSGTPDGASPAPGTERG